MYITDIDKFRAFNPQAKISSEITISLTTIPPRLFSADFERCLRSLSEQVLKARKIVVNLPRTYRRNFGDSAAERLIAKRLDVLQGMFADIEFNRIETDFGPASKLLGIRESGSYQESEITLVVDDDILYDKHLVAAHALAHAIYQCDVVGCDQRYLIQTWEPYRFHQHAELFAEVDDINVYGFLSFSIRNSLIADLKRYYDAVNTSIPEAFFHDDAVFSGFVRNFNLNKVRMNYPPIQQVERLSIDGQQGHALREMEESSHLARLHIEEKLKSLSIPTMPETAIGIIAPSRRRYPEFACVSNTHVRNTSREISVICTYLGPNLFLLTLQMFSDEYSQNSVDIFIVTSNREHRLCVTPRSKKSSYVIETHASLNALCFPSGVKRIFQTAPNKKITKHRLYSICSVIGNSFGVDYQFYDDNDVANFVNANGSILVRRAFDRLRPGAYKMDLFRYLALYVEGGIYLDCKIILNGPIEEFYQLRDKAEQCTLVRDQIEGYIYISMLGFYRTQSWILGYALKIVVFNVLNNRYGRDFLSITGPGIFPEIFYMRDYPTIALKNSRINDSEDWRQSGVTDSSGRWIALNSYHDYYEESNHLTSTHYSSFYQQNQVYHTDLPTQYKALSKSVFDGVSGLLWINLDRAVVRRQRMEKMLANLSIPAHRISAYDGKMPLPVSTEGRSSPYEVGCLLSHLAAIRRAQSMPGDVFLVLEDDMELSYLPVLRPADRVKSILRRAPVDWELIMVSWIYNQPMHREFVDWQKEFSSGPSGHIAGTGAYLVRRHAIDRICQLVTELNDRCVLALANTQHSDGRRLIADVFLYSNLKTYVYRGRLLKAAAVDSFINQDDIDWHTKTQSVTLNPFATAFPAPPSIR